MLRVGAAAWLGFAVLTFPGAQTRAAVIVDRSPPADQFGLNSNIGGAQIADDLSFASPVTITNVTWWGMYFGYTPVTGLDFQLRFFPDAGGVPSSTPWNDVLVNPVITSDIAANNASIYRFVAGLSTPIVLPSGDAWISVLDSDSDSTVNFAWLSIGDPGGGADQAFRTTDAGTWVADNTAGSKQRAFVIYGDYESDATIPEPSTLVLASGLLVMWLARSWRVRPAARSARRFPASRQRFRRLRH